MPFVVLADGPGLVFVVFESAASSAADLPSAAFVAFRLAATPICRRPGCASSQTAGPRPDAFDRADGASFLGARVQSPLTAVYPTGLRLHARAAWIMRPASV